MLLRIEQRCTGPGSRVRIVAVHAIDSLHGKVGVFSVKGSRIDLMALQANFSLRKREHELIVLGVGIMAVTTLSLPDRRMKLLCLESFS